MFGVQLSPEARGPDPVVIQPVKPPSNRKPETGQPKKPGQCTPSTKARPDSRSQHSFDTEGLSHVESSSLSPKSARKTRAAKRVSVVQLPLSPATSHSPPRVQPRSRKPKVNIKYTSTTINLSSDNVNPAGATEVTHTRRMKRKRVVESEDESEPTTKKPKSGTTAVERTNSPRLMGATHKTRRNAAKENPRHETSPTSIDANDPEALLEAEQVEPLAPPATVKRGPEVLSAKVNIVEEKVKGQPRAYSPSQSSNGPSNASERE